MPGSCGICSQERGRLGRRWGVAGRGRADDKLKRNAGTALGVRHYPSRISLALNPGYTFEQYRVAGNAGAKSWSIALIRAVIIGALILLLTAALATAEPLTIKIGSVGRVEKQATISLLDYPPANDGVAGARLALDDNHTT